MVPLFGLQTKLGRFVVSADEESLEPVLNHTQTTNMFLLSIEGDQRQPVSYWTPYDALKAVAGHSTGWSDWDESDEKASDYAGDWERLVTHELRMSVLHKLCILKPHATWRELDDDRHHYFGYLADRIQAIDCFHDLLLAGHIQPRSPDLMPAEYGRLDGLAKRY